MDLGLSDRVYVVTGGSRGLGRATANALVADGARVVVSSRDADHVAAAVDALGNEHAVGLVGDVADPALPQRLVDTALDRFGRLDGGLVSVGGPPREPLSRRPTSSGARRSSPCSSARSASTRHARAAARRGDGGSVALVLSTSVKSPAGDLAISNGLRPGLGMVVKDARRRGGPPRRAGQRPAARRASTTDRVRQLDDAPSDPPRPSWPRGDATSAWDGTGEPEEFGRVAAFVLSPAACYVTGVAAPGRRRPAPLAVTPGRPLARPTLVPDQVAEAEHRQRAEEPPLEPVEEVRALAEVRQLGAAPARPRRPGSPSRRPRSRRTAAR